MNGRTSKLLRKVAKTLGRDPKYIKKHYKSMTSSQKLLYKTYITNSLDKITQGKEVQNGENLPTLPETNSSTRKRE